MPKHDELNYETSQVKCPYRDELKSSNKCQKSFKNIMALNVHLQMSHKQNGIITASNKYLSRVGRYHCPIETCTFHCFCHINPSQSFSFANFNSLRLHYLRQHAVKKEQCSKCLKLFGLHQDRLAHEKICGMHCPFSCSYCDQSFQNRTTLRRHQLKFHLENMNSTQNDSTLKNHVITRKPRKSLKPPSHRSLLSCSTDVSHPPVIVNPLALELLNKQSHNLILSPEEQVDSDKAIQTYTTVSVGTECCSLTNVEFGSSTSTSIKTTEQKSSQTVSSLRMSKKRNQASSSATNDVATNGIRAPTIGQWKNVYVTDTETQITTPLYSDMCIQTVSPISNLLDYSSQTKEDNHNAFVQTLPISTRSTQMQTNPVEPMATSYYDYLLPYKESVGTSCFYDEFLFNDILTTEEPNSTSSVLSDFNAIDLFDLIDNSTQTHPSITTNETQTITDWNNISLTEDEWIQAIMNT